MSEIPPVYNNTIYCANHPQTETLLRCNRCGKPICGKCSVLTPTGYRCKECVSGQQKVYETSKNYDFLIAMPIAAVIAFAGSFVAQFFAFFALFIGPIVGVLIAEAVRWAIKKRRSKLVFQLTTAAAVIGALVLPLLSLAAFLLGFRGLPVSTLIWGSVYAVLLGSTVYYRLSGIQVR